MSSPALSSPVFAFKPNRLPLRHSIWYTSARSKLSKTTEEVITVHDFVLVLQSRQRRIRTIQDQIWKEEIVGNIVHTLSMDHHRLDGAVLSDFIITKIRIAIADVRTVREGDGDRWSRSESCFVCVLAGPVTCHILTHTLLLLPVAAWWCVTVTSLSSLCYSFRNMICLCCLICASRWVRNDDVVA